jgi:hypothetical protein
MAVNDTAIFLETLQRRGSQETVAGWGQHSRRSSYPRGKGKTKFQPLGFFSLF